MDSQGEMTLPIEEIKRMLETIPVEINLLEPVENYLSSLLAKEKDQAKIKHLKDNMINNLVRRVQDWQFFGDGKKGLNSGSVGEAIAHMVGLGILDDFPEMRKYTKGDRIGVESNNDPKTKDDLVNFQVNCVVQDEENTEYIFVGFKFNTSKQNVSDRIANLRNQRDTLRTFSQKPSPINTLASTSVK